jgi:DNA (cytosine-5)-methyltransferase 3A
MNILSLFDGISSGRLALERAGIEIENYYASEIDKYAIEVAQRNYPSTIELGDIKNVDVSKLPKIDLLIGGSPCQSFSFAGIMNGMSTKMNEKITSLERYLELKEEGFEFEGQSYLFWEYMRILNDIHKYNNPNVLFLLENVKMVKDWENVITNAIGVNPLYINSTLISAQRRERIYWTNIDSNITQPKDKNLKLKDILEEKVEDKYFVSDFIQNRLQLRDRTDNSGVIGTTKPNFRKIGQRDCVYGLDGKMGTLMASDYKQPKQILVTVNNNPKVRKLTPLECERLQTLPDNYTSSLSDTQRYKVIGNGWTIDVIAYIFKHIKKLK